MATPSPALKNPIKLIINVTVVVFTILFIAYVGLKIAFVYSTTGELNAFTQNAVQDFIGKIELIAANIWSFVKPFLQLGIVLIIIEWLLNRFGISFISRNFNIEWNVQTVIAIIIISAFSISALGSVGYVDYLKDVALVVVGFYFGSQKKVTEYVDKDKNIKVSEEHIETKKTDSE